MAEIPDDLPSATALKIATARQRKDTADLAFKSGNVKDGAYFMLAMWATSRSVCLISFEIVPRGNRFQSITSRFFSLTIQALMYLLGLDKYVFPRGLPFFYVEPTVLCRNALQSLGMSAPPPADVTDASKGKERTEVGPRDLIVYRNLTHIQVDDILEKIYANMSACHLKNQNWKRALETADKVKLFIFKIVHCKFLIIFNRPSQRMRITIKPCSGKGRHWENRAFLTRLSPSWKT